MPNEYAYLAMNRFANGANTMSLRALAKSSSLTDAQNWLVKQLVPYILPDIHWTSKQAISAHYHYKLQQQKAKQSQALAALPNSTLPSSKSASGMSEDTVTQNAMVGDPIATRRNIIESTRTLAQQTALATISSKQPLQAKLLDFFSNHFAVSRANLPMTLLAPTLEIEAIAPNLSASFADMLTAVTAHPAMLLYLNNERSMGPNSRQGKNRTTTKRPGGAGLNENLAREIMELHTLGVDSGYSQTDVTEFARAITGWSIGNPRRKETPGFLFRENMHEPGQRTILGKTYKASAKKSGKQQGVDILQDLATHPATAQHISHKLAKHFIADNPDPELVGAMTEKWLATSGNIKAVVATMILHQASWQLKPQKLKTPREFVVSACNACGVDKPSPNLYQTLEILGQGFFNSGSPAGYADTQEAWLGASALNARIEWSSHFADVITKHKKQAPAEIANKALGPLLSDDSLQAIKRAESKQQAMALFLMSPEFQRR
jgi:uncharacterized protein (DUF1800 family)